jgi:hypothetical protein
MCAIGRLLFLLGAPILLGFLGFGVPMTLSVALFKVDFYEECIPGSSDFNGGATSTSRTIFYPSRTHLYSGYCFGFLIAYISGFFGPRFRAFPRPAFWR